MLQPNKNKVFEELTRCAQSFKHFAQSHIKIVDINGTVVPLRLNEAQLRIIKGLKDNPHLMILKARKLGSTTLIAAFYLWKALFSKNTRVAVVAHTDEAARAIFQIYQFMYSNLPTEIRIPAEKNRHNELLLKTGSQIKVGTSSSEGFRGQTYQYIHASEYAFWTNLEKSIAGLFGTADANATIILESTANGLNQAYEMWNQENGFKKLFLGWMLDTRYVRPKAAFKDLTKLEREYIKKHKLSQEQSHWFVHHRRTKCANNWLIFNQEFPVHAEMAFVTSGQRFFPDPWPVSGITTGLAIHQEPEPYHIYTIGVDTASGSPGGDYSAFMVLDVTDQKAIKMVASYYDRQPPSDYKQTVLEIAEKYTALAVVESNSYGLSIIEYLMENAYGRQFRDQHWDKVKNIWTPRYGFNTNTKSRNLLLSRLYEYVSNSHMKVTDKVFMAEANTLVYNSRGKVEAPSGKHDDMVMATGLALMGLDQVEDLIEEVANKVRPTSIKQMLEWERATGKNFKDANPEEFSPDPLQDLLDDVGVW